MISILCGSQPTYQLRDVKAGEQQPYVCNWSAESLSLHVCLPIAPNLQRRRNFFLQWKQEVVIPARRFVEEAWKQDQEPNNLHLSSGQMRQIIGWTHRIYFIPFLRRRFQEWFVAALHANGSTGSAATNPGLSSCEKPICKSTSITPFQSCSTRTTCWPGDLTGLWHTWVPILDPRDGAR